MRLDHVCTMLIHMLLDNDAYSHDAYICDIQSLTMLHVCMMRLKFCDQPTNQPTDKAILGVGCSMPIRMKHVSMMHACVMHVKNGDGRTDGRTNGKLNSRSRIELVSASYILLTRLLDFDSLCQTTLN